MGLESTIVCVDNSDYMRNGDYLPTRLQAQQDAVNLVCHAKTRQHPENNIGLVTLGGGRVLLTLTGDVGRVLSKLHEVQPSGNINFLSSVRIAQLALKHRQGKNHAQRIVAFVGSPIDSEVSDMVKLAKRLKKEKVNVDVINFGEEGENDAKLTKFIDTINGKEGTTSHLVSVPPGPMLSEALVHSPVVAGSDGQPAIGAGAPVGYGFDFDPNEDPELALALRVSMEEQRARQEAEARNAASETPGADTTGAQTATNEEEMLQSALGMSESAAGNFRPDYDAMTEEEQIAFALQMSMAGETEAMDTAPTDTVTADAVPIPEAPVAVAAGADDYTEDMDDPDFLQGVLANLPGVDPNSQEIKSAMSQLTKKDGDDKGGKK